VSRVIFDYVLGDYVHWWNLVIYVIGEICELCGNVYMLMFVIFCDTCTLGDSNEMWIICMWFGDFFGDDDFFTYTFEVINCICW
jgi:hypothetical protein